MEQINKKKIILCFTCTVLFWVIAHGYRLANNLYISDSLISVFQDDIYYQRSLGRFMQPFTMIIRGTICAPWLIGIIAIVFFSVAIYLILDIFAIDNLRYLFLVCGILSCNLTITISVASYLPWLDIYGVALFLAAFGVWCYRKNTLIGYATGTISLVCCMGFYQAYIDVALALIAMLLIRSLWDNEDLKSIISYGIKMVSGAALSGILYYIIYKTVCKIHHVTEANSYNSLSGLGNYTGISVVELVGGAYKNFFDFLASPGTFVSTYLLAKKVSDMWQVILLVCLAISILFVICGIILLNYYNKTSWLHRIFQILLLLGLPLAINFVYILSKGMEHELMIYSFFLMFVFVVVVMQECGRMKELWRKIGVIAIIPICVFIWNNIVFSNQLYFKVDMQDQAGLSMATRIACDIEEVDGYEPNVTKVAFVGSLDKSEYIQPVIYLKEITSYGNGKTPFSYDNSFPIYLEYYLNMNLNITDIDFSLVEIKEMPEYPIKGYIRFVEDVLVVKLSD